MKNKLTVLLFAACLSAGLLLIVLLPDEKTSASERRLLRQFPGVTLGAVMDGGWMGDFEKYLLDQFPARDAFRGVKARTLHYVLRQSDNGGLYTGESGHLFKPAYPINAISIEGFAKKLNQVYADYLEGLRVFYAVIPDKAQYEAGASERLLIPYEEQLALAARHINADMTLIPLYDRLSLDAYYRTDLHWRQEALKPVADRLGEYMGFALPPEDMESHFFAPFYGAYYGQSALNPEPDTLVYLTSALTERARVDDMEHPQRHGVYYTEGLAGMDAYDVFLNGATPLITITDPEGKAGRHLVIFRDSYTSSLAPLLIGAYDSITLVDLRYIAASRLGEYVSFEGKDVLFLYGEQVLSASAMLK